MPRLTNTVSNPTLLKQKGALPASHFTASQTSSALVTCQVPGIHHGHPLLSPHPGPWPLSPALPDLTYPSKSLIWSCFHSVLTLSPAFQNQTQRQSNLSVSLPPLLAPSWPVVSLTTILPDLGNLSAAHPLLLLPLSLLCWSLLRVSPTRCGLPLAFFSPLYCPPGDVRVPMGSPFPLQMISPFISSLS